MKAKLFFLGVLSLATLLAGCCRFKQCDCVEANVEMHLDPASAWCNSDSAYFHYAKVFDADWSQSGDYVFNDNCTAWVYVTQLPKHIVFYKDTTGLDTISFLNATIQKEEEGGCCDCNMEVTQIEYTLNGIPYTRTGRVITVPF